MKQGKRMQYEPGDIFILKHVSKHLPRDMYKVPAVTNSQRPVEAYYDYSFHEWTFDRRFPGEQIEFWFERNEQLKSADK